MKPPGDRKTLSILDPIEVNHAQTRPRDLIPPTSRGYAIQTVKHLARMLQSLKYDENHVRRELEIIDKHRHWEVLGYPTRSEFLEAELDEDLFELAKTRLRPVAPWSYNEKHLIPPERALARQTREGAQIFKLNSGVITDSPIKADIGRRYYWVDRGYGQCIARTEELPSDWLCAYAEWHRERNEVAEAAHLERLVKERQS